MIDNGAAVVYVPVPGYAYNVVHTDGVPTAVLGVGIAGAKSPVVVAFLPDISGAAIIDPVGGNIIVP